MTDIQFSDLHLHEALLRAIADKGYTTPTPIQLKAIPELLRGRDLVGIAETGTGKTAAFALPILQAFAAKPKGPQRRAPRALVLTPTRELALQIRDGFEAYGAHLPIRHTVVFGGVGQAPQVRALADGVHVLVATPGRLLDLLSQGHVDLSAVEIFVLDEADRMLDMGFIHDVKRVIAKLGGRHQSLLFSATMPTEISRLAASLLRDPVRVEVAPPATTVERIEQRVLFVDKSDKRALLTDVLAGEPGARVLVFTRTKHGADRVTKHLKKAGVPSDAIHGDKSQGARERALDGFREGRFNVLVATDIAARGIDIPDISHVVNFDLPNIPESYVHRIGRTARAGRSGFAISFCDAEEREYLADIEKLIRAKLTVFSEHPYRASPPAAKPVPKLVSTGRPNAGRGRGRGDRRAARA